MIKPIKKSEARILLYLSVAPLHNRYVAKLTRKLDMDSTYAYTLLGRMTEKNWISCERTRGKTFYSVADESKVMEAQNLLQNINKTKEV